MEREHENEELLELGVASIETQGPPGFTMEFGGLWDGIGISAE